MEKIKKNLSKYIKWFLLLGPLLDLLTGVFVHHQISITIGIIVRVLFLFFMMFICVFIYKKRSALFVYLALLFYSIFYFIGIVIFKDSIGLFSEVQGLLKVIYFPSLLYSIYVLKDDLEISINTLYKTLVLYVLFIFIPTILGIGYKTYEITKSGSLGFFNSANEISGIISILTPILFIKLKDKKYLLLQCVFIMIYLITILNMGTKTPLLSLIIILIVVCIYYLIEFIRDKKYKLLTSILVLLIVSIASISLILPKTNFYKNIQLHLDFLGVDNVFEVFTEFNLIDHFIFSQRLTFLSDEAYLYNQSSPYQKLFGRGYLDNGEETKMIEMDYFDIYFHHGLVGFILFFSIYLYVLYKLIRQRAKYSFERLMIYTSVFLIFLLSLFSGHIIIAPSVNMIVVIILLLICKKIKLCR